MLTTQQLQTLKTNILANFTDPVLYPSNSDGADAIASEYNKTATPTFIVWKTNVSLASIGDAFNGSEFANLTTANTSRLQALTAFFMQRGINPSRADMRSMFADIFSTGGVTAAALLVLWKRAATRGERLFATGTGSDASPGTLVFEGSVTLQDVESARNLP